MSESTRVVDFPGAQIRSTEVFATKGLFTNVVINSVLAESATQTLDQVCANGATTTKAISITNARPGLTQTDAALTVESLGVNANVVATNYIARLDGSVSAGEGTEHRHALQLFAPGGSSDNASLFAGYDPTADVGYVNASRSGSTRPLCLQTRGSDVGIGTAAPTKKMHVYTNAGESNTQLLLQSADRYASLHIKDNAGGVILQNDQGDFRLITGYDANDVGGTEKFRVTSAGDVGIGTNSPTFLLDLYRYDGADVHLRAEPNSNDAILYLNGAALNQRKCAIIASPSGSGWCKQDLHFCQNLNSNYDDATVNDARMTLRGTTGRLGINVTDPIAQLDVRTTSNSTEPNNRVAIANDGYWNYLLCGTTHPTNASGNNTRVYFRAVANGTTAPSAATKYDTVQLYTNYIGYSGGSLGSDDRRKFNEIAIENACDTLNKLKPQVYDKHAFEFDTMSVEEYSNAAASNVSTEGYVLVSGSYKKRRISDHFHKEAGLIAQDVYYDAPELRYLVKLGDDADPDDEKPETPDDIQQDPDYDAAGWGVESASLDYNSLIAYLVKANQELDARVRELESRI